MPLSDETILAQAKARYLLSREFAEPFRQEARRSQEFVAGHQISKEDMANLERDKRPAVVFNFIGPNIKAITGMERGNRHEIKYMPREKSITDGQVANIYNQTCKWVFDRNDNEFHESRAFRDMCITGMGWTQTRAEFFDDPDGKIVSPAIDPLRKLWDPSARAENLSDRRYDFTEVLMDQDSFEAMGKEFENFVKDNTLSPNVFGELLNDDLVLGPIVEHRPDGYAGGESDTDHRQFLGKIAVLEYNFYVYEEVFQLIGGDGKVMNEFVSKARASQLKEEVPEFQVLSIGKQRRYYKAWFNGNELVAQQPNNDPKAFTDYCVTGEFDPITGQWFGVVRSMIDPSNWSNKLFMQLLHIINSNAKGGFFFKKGAFVNKAKALADWAKGNMGIEVGGENAIDQMIRERVPTPMPTAIHELLLFVTGIIPRVSGFNMELLGMSGKDQPGILEHMRKQAGMTILAPFFDSLRFYRRAKGQGLIHFMKTYIGVDRISRIVDDESRAALATLSLPDVDKFDVFVEESPYSPNLKLSNFIMLSDFLQTQPALAGLIGDLILEQSPLPAPLVQEIKKRMEASRKPDPERTARETRKMIAEIVRDEMAAMRDRATAELTMAKVDTERRKPAQFQDKLDVDVFKEGLEAGQTLLQTRSQANG